MNTYKILVVDDERIFREGTRGILESIDGLEPLEAKNGSEALDILRKQDIHAMVLDIKMPRMDGIELLSALKQENRNDIITIVVSGHDEFEYARGAMQYGVNDYLLKPLIPDQVRELGQDLLERLVKKEKREKDYQELVRRVEESKPVLKELFFHDIVHGKIGRQDLSERADFIGFKPAGNCFRIAVIELNERGGDAGKRNELERQMSLMMVEEKLLGLIDTKDNYELFHSNTETFALMANYAEASEENSQEFYDVLESANSLFRKEEGESVYIGVGDYARGIENARRSYYQAVKALFYRETESEGIIYSIRDFEDPESDEAETDSSQIAALVRTGDSQKLGELISRELRRIKSDDLQEDVFSLYALCNRYLTAFFSVLRERGIRLEEQFEERLNILFEILYSKSFNQLETWLFNMTDHVVSLFSKLRKDQQNFLYEQVRGFIDKNFNKAIGNSEISSALGYSPNYLGYVFKKVGGMTINEYLNKARIGEARRLLSESTMNIAEIAHSLGFTDQHYFSSVFKKHAGVPPKEYRALSTPSTESTALEE